MASLPPLPAEHHEFIRYLAKNPTTNTKEFFELIQPYKDFDAKTRELFAQDPEHTALKNPHVNVVPIFDSQDGQNEPQKAIEIRARDLKAETEDEKEKYIIPLNEDDRKPSGTPAVVQSLKEFRHNFNVFTELSLVDMDWSNVVVAGSAAATALMPVPEKYKQSKRALRKYYHETIAPASDVDLFLYGLTEEEAKAKIKQIETKVRDAILQETTTVRTKHAITIASAYPTRHVQIVLRIYRSIGEILTGFDVDCSCVAYDGHQVYMAPRAIGAYMTQINQIDMTRRSPSYENRLSKYSHRGFEIYWPQLDRSRIDPSLFERSFSRVQGLARLLALEKLPTSQDRENYTAKRRRERGRPELNSYRRHTRGLRGDIKGDHEDEVAEWVEQDEVSDYHTFTIPYGPNFTARKIEKLLYTKDLLLNAEWNKPKDREVHLHRHPAFFGRVEDIFEDCCGSCPLPVSEEELEVAVKESAKYVSGTVSFLKDDPGRQSIGSFNPITDQDWTEMAYVGNLESLCQAIVDDDIEHVQGWLAQDGANPNQRDHTGRTPLQLAVTCSSPQVVRCLVNHGCRLVARVVDGRTALHMAAARGNVEILKIILEKSEANEAEEEMKTIRRKDAKKHVDEEEPGHDHESDSESDESADSDQAELIDEEASEDDISIATGSFVKVDRKSEGQDGALPEDDNEDEPDFYDVNVLSWDTKVSPLHTAIAMGHSHVVRELCQTFGADILLPIKLLNDYDKSPRGAILTLVLALSLPLEKAKEMAKTLLDLGATSSQGDIKGITAFHYYVHNSAEAMLALFEHDRAAALSVLNHVACAGSSWYPTTSSPLLTAIERRDSITALKLLDQGAYSIEFGFWIKSARTQFETKYNQMNNPESNKKLFLKSVEQPIVIAIIKEQPTIVLKMLAKGADPNSLTKTSHEVIHEEHQRRYHQGQSILDLVVAKLQELRDYDGEKEPGPPPEPLEKDDFYLGKLEKGTYQFFVATTDLKHAREAYDTRLKAYQTKVKKANETQSNLQEKQVAIKSLIADFEQVEQELIKRGAKTFKEIHPDIEDPTSPHTPYQPYQPLKPKPFEVKFSFKIGELTDQLRDLYLALFQAAWEGDIAAIKSLTLMPQGEEKTEPPLKIAVLDSVGLSPFSIAVMRNHLSVAKTCVEIASLQYVPKDKESAQERYSMAHEDSYSDSECSDSSGDNIQVYSELVDDTFTVENIGEVSLQVKSSITPLQFMLWEVPITRFRDHNELPKGGYDPKTDIPSTLLSWAITLNDLKLLEYLIQLGMEYSPQGTKDNRAPSRNFGFPESDFLFGVALGRIQLISHIMKHTGAGIPLDRLVKKSGVEVKEKPKYYQGLTVHGKKRTDWAAAGREMRTGTPSDKISPLLYAASFGRIESVEFMLSDTPLRLYGEFARTNHEDQRLQRLSAVSGGIDEAVSKWFREKSDLVLHCAVLATPSEHTERLLSYLIEVFPASLEKKNSDGLTPLNLAFRFGRVSLAKILVAANADQATRDSEGGNLIHNAVISLPSLKTRAMERFREALDLVDPKLRQQMFVQRISSTSGGTTPLHAFVQKLCVGFEHNTKLQDRHVAALKMLLDYSGGKELMSIDSSGDTILHTIVAAKATPLADVLIDFNPKLLSVENAVGRTPIDCACDQYLAEVFSNPPDVVEQYYNRWNANADGPNIIDRNLESFSGKATDKRSASKKMWDLIKECIGKSDVGQRRLVKLNEANEVARRLGEMSKMKDRKNAKNHDENASEESDEEDVGDVTTRWYSDTHSWREYGDKVESDSSDLSDGEEGEESVDSDDC